MKCHIISKEQGKKSRDKRRSRSRNRSRSKSRSWFYLSIYLSIYIKYHSPVILQIQLAESQPAQSGSLPSQYSLSPSPEQTPLLQYSALIFVYMALHICATILVLAVSPLIKLVINFQSSSMLFLHMLA